MFAIGGVELGPTFQVIEELEELEKAGLKSAMRIAENEGGDLPEGAAEEALELATTPNLILSEGAEWLLGQLAKSAAEVPTSALSEGDTLVMEFVEAGRSRRVPFELVTPGHWYKDKNDVWRFKPKDWKPGDPEPTDEGAGPEPEPEPEKQRVDLTQGELGQLKYHGGGISGAFTGKITMDDGSEVKVLVKVNRKGGRARASQKVAEHLGVPTPQVAHRLMSDYELANSQGQSNQKDAAQRRLAARGEPVDIDVEVQEWDDDFKTKDLLVGEGMPLVVTRDEAERFAALDAVLGNADRNPGNYGVSNGKLTAIDHDFAFEVQTHENGRVDWAVQPMFTQADPQDPRNPRPGWEGDPLWADEEPFSDDLRNRLEEILDNREEWEETFREMEVPPESYDGFFQRVEKLLENGRIVEHKGPDGWAVSGSSMFGGVFT